jgi:hypothetical protein
MFPLVYNSLGVYPISKHTHTVDGCKILHQLGFLLVT